MTDSEYEMTPEERAAMAEFLTRDPCEFDADHYPDDMVWDLGDGVRVTHRQLREHDERLKRQADDDR
jgi:hypothetical protein